MRNQFISALIFLAATSSGFAPSQSRLCYPTNLQYAIETDTIQPKSFETAHRNIYPTGRKITKYDLNWNERYKELQEFYKVHGHADVPYNHSNKKLNRWVTNQRQKRKKGKTSMIPNRIAALDALGFTWCVKLDWETRYSELQAFYKKYGHCDVPPNTKEYIDLARFVAAQRRQYRLRQMGEKNSMSDERLKALTSIAFPFDTTELTEDNWLERFQKLDAYHSKNGNCHLSSGHPLRRWANLQRIEYEKLEQGMDSSLTEFRIKMMNDLNFVWDVQEVKWYDRFEDLKRFHHQKGHCEVCESNAADPDLCAWVQKQVESYAAGNLDESKHDSLTALGVSFERHRVPSSDDCWESLFNELTEYADLHGNCLVPQHCKENPKLGLFVKNQRRQYKLLKAGKKSSLTQSRKEKLESIGFIWDVRQHQREYKDSKLRIISVRAALKKSLDEKVIRMSQESIEENADLLLESYENVSLWGR